MTTYREAIYMCLDLIKGISDDFTYTEEHIAYLLDKYRALLLKQRYGNDPKKHVPYSNYQTLHVGTTQSDIVPYRPHHIIKLKKDVPYMLHIGIPRLYYEGEGYYKINYEYVSRERFPFVGKNKYLKNIIYFTIDDTNSLIIHNKDKYWAIYGTTTYIGPTVFNLVSIFENPRDIIGEDYLDAEFPIEEGLVTTLIDLVVKEILGASYRPADTTNNNMDDNSDMASYIASNMKPSFQKQLGV